MPMEEVVQTTVLSKRWKNLWTTTPYLDFDRHSTQEIDTWVRLAKDNGVEELYLDNRYTCDLYEVVYDNVPRELLYSVPHNLYSCSSLKVLLLKGCVLQVSGNVQWNQLRSLTIEGVYLDEHLINQIVSGSPQLEVFILKLLDNDENLSIRSNSLRTLLIDKCLYSTFEDPSTVTELRIWSPNLETLTVLGVPYQKCLLMNVSSLTDLTLGFYGPIPYESSLFYGIKFLGETLGQIFPTIQHVEKVTLSDWCIEVLGWMKEKYLLSPLSNFKFLTFNRHLVRYSQLVDILQIFPKLEMLVLKSNEDNSDHFWPPMRQVERNLPEGRVLSTAAAEDS